MYDLHATVRLPVTRVINVIDRDLAHYTLDVLKKRTKEKLLRRDNDLVKVLKAICHWTNICLT